MATQKTLFCMQARASKKASDMAQTRPRAGTDSDTSPRNAGCRPSWTCCAVLAVVVELGLELCPAGCSPAGPSRAQRRR